MTCQTVKCKLKTASPWFYQRKGVNQRSGRCVFCFFCKTWWKSYNTAACVVCSCVPCGRKSPFAISRSQAIPVQHWSGDWRDWQTSFACLFLPGLKFACPFLYLSMNHIGGLQTAQQAPTGELVMFSPLWSHSSLRKLLTIYLDVIIVCNIIKEKNLHFCCLANSFFRVYCWWRCVHKLYKKAAGYAKTNLNLISL